MRQMLMTLGLLDQTKDEIPTQMAHGFPWQHRKMENYKHDYLFLVEKVQCHYQSRLL